MSVLKSDVSNLQWTLAGDLVAIHSVSVSVTVRCCKLRFDCTYCNVTSLVYIAEKKISKVQNKTRMNSSLKLPALNY